MNVFNFGDPKLFVKGVATVTIIDPTTGSILGFDNTPTESSVTGSVNAGEVTGGIGAPVLILIPDTSRLSGSLSSNAFSLGQRRLITGGTLKQNGIVPVCATNVAPSAGVLKIPTDVFASNPPVKHYGQPDTDTLGWCFVKVHGSDSYQGSNVGVNLTTGVVNGSYTEAAYDIFYYSNPASATELGIPSNFIPQTATVEIKFNVYSKQSSSVASGSLAGYLYLIVPRAQFNGDPGISASQTDVATTDYSWTALRPDADAQSTSDYRDCSNESSNYAYYVYVPCGDVADSVESLFVAGGVLSVAKSKSATIPVKYLMKNGEVAQPSYGDLTYVVTASSLGTVTNGVFTAGSTAGNGKITITLTNNSNVKTVMDVIVTD